MRFVICGAGAIGGVLGARLNRAGDDVVFVARGEHGRTLADGGITLVTPEERVTMRVPTVATVDAVGLRRGDVVLLAVKSQDTEALLDAMALAVDAATDLRRDDLAVVCVQNGVRNEPEALRRFAHVHGVGVMFPTEHLVAGEVRQNSAPIPGILDVGRWPSGSDAVDEELRAAFVRAGFVSDVVEDIAARKHRKLLMNLGNVVEVVCGPGARGGEIIERLTGEGEAALAAAGIAVQPAAEDLARRADHLHLRRIEGERRSGGSTWQSVVRGAGSTEVEFLTGEIVRLGREHGVPVPLNERLLELAGEVRAGVRAPGAMPVDELLAMA